MAEFYHHVLVDNVIENAMESPARLVKLISPLPVLLFCIVALLASACARKEQPRHYALRGVVVSLDPNTNVAKIHNENIPGWMAEMTMEYPVENRDEYKSLHPGDNISATVNVTSDGYYLTNVHKIQGR